MPAILPTQQMSAFGGKEDVKTRKKTEPGSNLEAGIASWYRPAI